MTGLFPVPGEQCPGRTVLVTAFSCSSSVPRKTSANLQSQTKHGEESLPCPVLKPLMALKSHQAPLGWFVSPCDTRSVTPATSSCAGRGVGPADNAQGQESLNSFVTSLPGRGCCLENTLDVQQLLPCCSAQGGQDHLLLNCSSFYYRPGWKKPRWC